MRTRKDSPNFTSAGDHQPLDQDLAAVVVLEGDDVDVRAPGPGLLGRLARAAPILVPVAQEDDPPRPLLGEGRQGQLDGGPDVRRATVRRLRRGLEASGSRPTGVSRTGLPPKVITPYRSCRSAALTAWARTAGP